MDDILVEIKREKRSRADFVTCRADNRCLNHRVTEKVCQAKRLAQSRTEIGLDGVTGIRKFAVIDIACSQPTKHKAK